MAVVKIWKITTHLDHTINYATNIEKTRNEEYAESYYNGLNQMIGVESNNIKTEKQCYVSGINCLPETAYKEMMITKQQYGKTDGILGFHAYQSFKGKTLKPELVHEIGIKLAEEMWGDRFEVIVTTHLDTNNYHNHFVINSVSFKDGKKYYANRSTYGELRVRSDNICKEYGVNILEEKPCKNSNTFYEKYYFGSIKQSNYYVTAKQNIDRAIEQAYSYSDFENLLKAMDYELIYRNKVLSIRRKPYKKNIRISRPFGVDYTREMIEKRIQETESTRIPFIEEYGIKKIKPKKIKSRNKSTGLKGLYLYYCYLLKIFPDKRYAKQVPATIRADTYKLDFISKEAELLSNNNINNYSEFIEYNKKINNLFSEKVEDRKQLWNKYRVTKLWDDKIQIKKEIENVSNEIDELNVKRNMCKDIEKRTKSIENNINEFEKGREKIK